MPKRVPAAVAVEDVLLVNGTLCPVLERPIDRPHIAVCVDPALPDEPFECNLAERDGTGKLPRIVRDPAELHEFRDWLLIRDPALRAKAEEKLSRVVDIRRQIPNLHEQARQQGRDC